MNNKKLTKLMPKKKVLYFSIDLEDHRKIKDPNSSRYKMNTDRILDWLDENAIKATVFTVGSLAKESPNLIRKIADKKHDIAFHSYDHTPLLMDNPKNFREKSYIGKSLLEDLSGTAITGFRAPNFSLTKNSIWALNILKELGFLYSSSTIPSWSGKYSFPGIPSEPFMWPQEIVEYPMVLSSFLGKSFPSIGGLYLRVFPISFALKTLCIKGIPWTHIHPQDIDWKEPFTQVENLSIIASYLYGLNRKSVFRKLSMIGDKFNFKSLQSNYNELDLSNLRTATIKNV